MGITTARGTYEFRKDRDYRLEKPKHEFVSSNPSVKDPNFTFGIQTKFDIVSYCVNATIIHLFF